jgi:glyceraldehyde-3-phosphate dehydrogenase (NADP+)
MRMLLNGEWVDREKRIEVRDPWDNHIIDTVPASSKADAELAVKSAVQGFEISKRLTVYERAQILTRAAQYIKDNLEDFARTIAMEGSKTIKEARKEANRCTNTLIVSAEESKRILGETIPFDSFPGGEKRVGYYYRFPIGVVLAITPFNDPLNLVAHKLGPAIAAGNSVVCKPATVTPLSALKLGEALLNAGLPPKILNIITGYGGEIGDTLVQDKRVRMVSFTGGTEAGERISKLAGIKKIGMELGSNSPVIVLGDCDMSEAVESCVSGAFWACGQNCIGVQRIYIEEPIYKKFVEKFVERTKKYKVGPKLEEDCDMGPMIAEGEAERVERWIREAVEKGAKVACGGKRKGTVVDPTVLTDVPETATIHHQEVFGPVVNLYPVKTLEEAITKSNSLNYGLHAAIFTRDVNKAFKAAYELDCGGVMINDSTDYRLDSMPFGGVKYSGLGREGLKFSLLEMTEPKVISFYLPDWRK